MRIYAISQFGQDCFSFHRSLVMSGPPKSVITADECSFRDFPVVFQGEWIGQKIYGIGIINKTVASIVPVGITAKIYSSPHKRLQALGREIGVETIFHFAHLFN